MPATAFPIPETPSQAGTEIAKETSNTLAPLLTSMSSLDLRVLNVTTEPMIRIPALAARLLVEILDEMSQGNAVRIVPVRADPSTQEKAGRRAALAELAAYDQEIGM